MGKKLHAARDVQLLVNGVMPWVETRLREDGQFSALAAWLVTSDGKPRTSVQMQSSAVSDRPLQEQERLLAEFLQVRWKQGELTAAGLVAPVLYGHAGSEERSMAVRLHIETQAGYCADILMPYRIRASSRWRGRGKNRVHFSHPVAQESEPRLGVPELHLAGEARLPAELL